MVLDFDSEAVVLLGLFFDYSVSKHYGLGVCKQQHVSCKIRWRVVKHVFYWDLHLLNSTSLARGMVHKPGAADLGVH